MVKYLLEKFSSALIKISSIILCIVAAVMVINIILRSAFNSPLSGTMEIVQYGMMICMALALSRTGFKDRHIRVSVLVDALPQKAKAVLLSLTMLISAVVFGSLIFSYLSSIPGAIASGFVTDIYRLPYYFVYIMMAIGMTLATIMFFYHAVASLAPFINKKQP